MTSFDNLNIKVSLFIVHVRKGINTNKLLQFGLFRNNRNKILLF